jgi:hypothetical protein
MIRARRSRRSFGASWRSWCHSVGIHLPFCLSNSGSLAKSDAICRASSIVMIPVCRALHGARPVEYADLLPGGILYGASSWHLDDARRGAGKRVVMGSSALLACASLLDRPPPCIRDSYFRDLDRPAAGTDPLMH